VKFGLHTNSAKEIEEILDGFGKFSVRLGSISRFTSSDDFDVLKIEVESEKLRELHRLLSGLPNDDKFKEYKPHATISYINKGSNYNLSGNDAFSGEQFEVDAVIFSPVVGNKITLKL
jgi:2'-5' RNA ligase